MSGQPMQKFPDTVYISFLAEIYPTSAEGLLEACTKLATNGTKTIYLMINSPGGSVSHGIAVHNALRALPCKIITHNIGTVDSIGNVVFLAGEERYANPGATFMFHGVSLNIQNASLGEKQLREQLDAVLADQKKIAHVIRSRTKFPNDTEIEQLFFEASVKDTEFAKARGIIHDVREAKLPPGSTVLQLVFKR